MKRYWTPPEGKGPSKRILIELLSVLSRVLPAAYFAIVCLGFWKNFVQTGKWTSLLWIASEGLIIVLLVFRRESRRLSRHPWDWIVALGGSFTVLLVRPATTAIAMESVGIGLQIAGTLFAIYAKIYLGRSFGIVAADRGIVGGGCTASSATLFTSATLLPMSDSCWPTGAPATSLSTSSPIFSRFRGSCRRSGAERGRIIPRLLRTRPLSSDPVHFLTTPPSS